MGRGIGGRAGQATAKCSILSQNLPDSSGFVCEFVYVTEYKAVPILLKPEGKYNS